jgi:hypothetical protein
MGHMDISRLEEEKKRKKEEEEESEQESEIKTQAQMTLGSFKNKEKTNKNKQSSDGRVKSGTIAFFCSIGASIIFYLVFMNYPLQIPGGIITSDVPIELPIFANFLFTILFCIVCYTILSDILDEN